MKAKEIEKLIRIFVPSGTLLGSNREKFISRLQELNQLQIKELEEWKDKHHNTIYALETGKVKLVKLNKH